jgi:hypothetical protein
LKQLLPFFTLCAITICQAQNQNPQREPLDLNLAVDTIHYYSAQIPKSPYFVKEKVLQIYPSEKLLIEAEIKGDSIYSMEVVKEKTHPEKTIEVEFSQDASDRAKISMMLIVKNPFNKKLNYNALMYTPTSDHWHSTSIIPIRPNLVNYETWGYTIISLVLDKWRFE